MLNRSTTLKFVDTTKKRIPFNFNSKLLNLLKNKYYQELRQRNKTYYIWQHPKGTLKW